MIATFEKFKNAGKVHDDINAGKEGISSISGRIPNSDPDPIKKLKKIVRKICDLFGFNSGAEYLNSGSYGMAFIVDKNKVIKLTSSKEEARIAKGLLGQNIPNMVRYYRIKRIKEYEIWAILMDRARGFNKEELPIMNIMDKYIYGKKILEDDVEEMRIEIKNENLFMDIFEKLLKDYNKMCKNLNKNRISTQDLHLGNIGYIGNDMVHFDIMGETSTEEISRLY